MAAKNDIINDKNLADNTGYEITSEPIKTDRTEQPVTNHSTQEIGSDPWYWLCCAFCLDVCYSWSRASLSAHDMQQFKINNSCAQQEEIDIGYNTKSALDHWLTLFIGYFIGETESSHSSNSDDETDSSRHVSDDDDDHESDEELEDEHEILAVK